MSETGLKLCRDCKWFKKLFFEPASLAKCRHQGALRFDESQLVGGDPPERRWCSDMRRSTTCGPEGLLWELK